MAKIVDLIIPFLGFFKFGSLYFQISPVAVSRSKEVEDLGFGSIWKKMPTKLGVIIVPKNLVLALLQQILEIILIKNTMSSHHTSKLILNQSQSEDILNPG